MPDGKLRPTPFIDLSKKIVKLDWEFDERGLLGMAFHPKFKDNGKFYVVYTAAIRTDAARRPRLLYCCTNYLSEFRVSKTDPNKADLSTERIIYFWDKPQFNHNGGDILFGPDDGYLYVSIGDGGWARARPRPGRRGARGSRTRTAPPGTRAARGFGTRPGSPASPRRSAR